MSDPGDVLGCNPKASNHYYSTSLIPRGDVLRIAPCVVSRAIGSKILFKTHPITRLTTLQDLQRDVPKSKTTFSLPKNNALTLDLFLFFEKAKFLSEKTKILKCAGINLAIIFL